jgi:hypothetical protein
MWKICSNAHISILEDEDEKCIFNTLKLNLNATICEQFILLTKRKSTLCKNA